jgi:PKD repeat protein
MFRRISRFVCLLAVAGWASFGPVGAAVASPPDNDSFANAATISALPYTDSGDLNGTSTEPGEFQFFNCSPMQQTVWYKLPATPDSKAIVANLEGSDSGVLFNVWMDFGGGLGNLGFVGCTFVGGSLRFTTQPGVTYYIQAGSVGTGPANLSLNVQLVPPPPNDNFENATVISARPYVDPFVDLASASVEPGEQTLPPGAFTPILASAWYSYTPQVTERLMATGNSCCVTPIVAVYTGSSLQSLSAVTAHSGPGGAIFLAEAGTTYHFQLGRGSLFGSPSIMSFALDAAPLPVANFFYYPQDPSIYDVVQFQDSSFDPGQIGITSQSWLFGDGTSGSGPFPNHRYVTDGDYNVKLTVATTDGRTGTSTQVVHVRTHDVAIVKLTAPNTARALQTKEITVGVRNTLYPENVQFQLLKSVPGSGFQVVGTLTQLIPVRQGNKTVPVTFSYTFSNDDAAVGKVTFQVVAQIMGARDSIPGDNTAIAAPTRVTP